MYEKPYTTPVCASMVIVSTRRPASGRADCGAALTMGSNLKAALLDDG
ncbi:MAG TPA: hypothetical protein VKR52_04145 [Terracidiphilus sp.]|nr:hypothetical protein [Terracidiphilus sp.]